MAPLTQQLEHRLVSATEAAELFGIPADWIHKWKYRHKLMPYGAVHGPSSNATVPLYRLADVAQLVADRHAREKERHLS